MICKHCSQIKENMIHDELLGGFSHKFEPTATPAPPMNQHRPGCPRYSGVGECDCFEGEGVGLDAAQPLAQAADEVLAELSLLNGKFTQKQSILFDKVRELKNK